jgi:hypothetical protein
MKLNETQHLLLIMIGAASLAASFAFGNTDSTGAGQEPVIAPSAESVVYFPAQYTLNAPYQVNEQLQAF